ncbi:MAG: carboxypeptidase regulatory-like domain-containing protein [Puniceicoccaceae bacterium]|nr:MAG: carboxypeptidase regulatory-like domain-containing protein [Puniceicoccaceae bacterium]
MNIRIILTLLFCQIPLAFSACAQAPKITITIQVVDEDNKPIESAHIRTGYIRAEGGHRVIEGQTDEDGIFKFSGRPGEHSIQALVKNAGFYESEKRFSVARSVQGYAVNSDTITDLTLRKIRNPVPMSYFQRRLVEVPEFNRDLEFDFEKADWVQPFGGGEIADALINVSGFYNERDDRKSILTIRFLNDHDGILVGDWFPESRLRSPHVAPESGYQQDFTVTFGRKKEGRKVENFGSRESDPLLIFRVRTEVDDEGNVIRANYGKIEEGISFDGVWDRQSHINFRHLFFNADSESVSLEYEGVISR